MSDAFIIHVSYEDILNEAAKLRDVDKKLVDRLTLLVLSMRDITLKLEPALTREIHSDEQKLWQEYMQLQEKKLLVLDLSHEYNNFEDTVHAHNVNLDVMIKDALEELSEHMAVQAETHRAYIDILEIQNARRLSLNAILVSGTIAYLAVWEYTVREFITAIEFPSGLSPWLNYMIAVLTLLPAFAAIVWSFLKRRAHLQLTVEETQASGKKKI